MCRDLGQRCPAGPAGLVVPFGDLLWKGVTHPRFEGRWELGDAQVAPSTVGQQTTALCLERRE